MPGRGEMVAEAVNGPVGDTLTDGDLNAIPMFTFVIDAASLHSADQFKNSPGCGCDHGQGVGGWALLP
jgi:hypothetical protein